jgi:hypothetical protein
MTGMGATSDCFLQQNNKSTTNHTKKNIQKPQKNENNYISNLQQMPTTQYILQFVIIPHLVTVLFTHYNNAHSLVTVCQSQTGHRQMPVRHVFGIGSFLKILFVKAFKKAKLKHSLP